VVTLGMSLVSLCNICSSAVLEIISGSGHHAYCSSTVS
jgi:hypothetical protein